jgi:asparagine synthase (glutamine-hydrolysing)
VSVQFGRWNFNGRPADREYLAKAEEILGPYAPDGGGTYIKDSVEILFRALHTTKESRSEGQPHITPSGKVLTWDGRLDNRAELIRQLKGVLTINSTDVSIAAAAYEEWGTSCFAKLIGDWALSLWNPESRSLLLAKDPIGTRHLYYSPGKDQVTWSTILDPLVLLAGKALSLCEEYIAGWFSFFPAAHLTPYVGIHAVPPSALVLIREGNHAVSKYWDFDPASRIRHRTDAEYEEHFRMVFTEAVRRRLRSDSPILAELSGGMDSSSIVCMADTVIAGGAAEATQLDTLSYYNDSEHNWDERPYFEKVEERRGRVGCHIDVGSHETFTFKSASHCFSATPASSCPPSKVTRRFNAHLKSQGYRIVLSGIGGDEVLGGVPTPIPELADLLATAQFKELAHQLKVWALNKRKPWFHLLAETLCGFLPFALFGVKKEMRPAPWLHPDFVSRNRVPLTGYRSRLRLLGPPPSFQENLASLTGLQRQLGCNALSSGPPYEKRYPYLDRTLLEFSFAIPREQLVRPGQRRSLMRRALAGVVPDAILDRRRKGFVSRSPAVGLAANWPDFVEITREMRSGILGVVDPEKFVEAARAACDGKEAPLVPIMRTLVVEFWLRGIAHHCAGELHDRVPAHRRFELHAERG